MRLKDKYFVIINNKTNKDKKEVEKSKYIKTTRKEEKKTNL